jgi:hypothetical protein
MNLEATRRSWLLGAGALLGCLAMATALGNESAGVPQAAPVERTAARRSDAPRRCTVRQLEDGWQLVAPNGEPFFSLGVCVFTQGTPREQYQAEKPSYAAWRHYTSTDEWAEANLRRLKAWGFTTIGGWSDHSAVTQSTEGDFYLTPVLHSGSTAGAPWFDMWDEKVLRRIDEVTAQKIAPLKNKARVLGYYSDNEIGWWNAMLWKMTLEQRPTSGQRQRLVALVSDAYENNWDAMELDFEPENAANWEELQRGGMLWLRPNSNGIRTMRGFLSLIADRYYQVMRDVIRKHDPTAMYLGDRYQSFYYPEIARASRDYVDVASTNLNASWNDGTFLRSYLDTLHALTGKPILVSEFYMAAKENRSGNKNSHGVFPQVETQRERAEGLLNTVQSLRRLPYVVGADWFQHHDEPPHGRPADGEDYNFGLVDIEDRPYEEVVAEFASLKLNEPRTAAPALRSDATAGVPVAPADPFANLDSMRGLRDWDRERGFVPTATKDPTGDLYICWSPKALYLGVYVLDIVELDYYRNNEIPELDRPVWSVRIGDSEAIAARVGAGKPPSVGDAAIRVESASGVYHDVRCINVMEVPAARLGKARFQAGDRIQLDSSFKTHARAHHIEWNGTLTLVE